MSYKEHYQNGLHDILKILPHGRTEWSSLGWKAFGISVITFALLHGFFGK